MKKTGKNNIRGSVYAKDHIIPKGRDIFTELGLMCGNKKLIENCVWIPQKKPGKS